MMKRECKSCGDSFDGGKRKEKLAGSGKQFYKEELSYCRECADELFRGIVKIQQPKLYSTGGGCPLEPNDEGGPWQENNIRALEEGREW